MPDDPVSVLCGGHCPEMVLIRGGTFMMGSPEGERGRYESEGPQHEVQVEHFWIGTYEVTVGEWAAFRAENPDAAEGCGSAADYPIRNLGRIWNGTVITSN